MADPRLNSIHLEAAPRRQDFRQARQALLGARGPNTLAADDGPRCPNDPNTLVPRQTCGTVGECGFVLMDRDFVYPLKVGINTFGRMPDNDIVLEDGGISRRHCAVLVHSENGCELHDMASKNGTYLNGRRLSGPARLHSGDEIRICNRQFVFLTQVPDKGRPAPPATAATRSEAIG